MPDKKSIIEEIEDKAAEVGHKIKETLDEIAADEDPPKFDLPEKDDEEEANSGLVPEGGGQSPTAG